MAKVVFTEPAEYDLMDIEHYIFVELCNPQASERIFAGSGKTGRFSNGTSVVK